MHPRLGRVLKLVKPTLGKVNSENLSYPDPTMGNGLRKAREKLGMSLQQAADALGMTKSGYTKKERSERGLKDDFIRRACEVFGVSPEQIIGEAGIKEFSQDIDQNKLASLITLARQRLGSLPESEARNLILALISASRRPPD